MATINFSKDLHGDAIKSVKAYKNIKAKIALLEAELDGHKATILAAMGDNDTATCAVGGITLTVTNKAVTATRLDSKAVKAKYPQVAEECSTTSTSPRFTVK